MNNQEISGILFKSFFPIEKVPYSYGIITVKLEQSL